MRTLEDIFVREFKSAVGVTVEYKDVYKISLPEESSKWEVSGVDMYKVKGVELPYYEILNDSVVKKLPKGVEPKRRIIDKAKRSFKKDGNGYVYESVQIPTGSMVVRSDKQINLPYSMYVKPEPGYGYIDFVDIEGSREYLYILPKEYLYKVNQTALVVSVKDMKNFWGRGYITWNMGKIFLHVIPYNPNSKYVGSKILATKISLNYSKEASCIIDYWQSSGLVPNIELSSLQSGENLCLKPTVVGYNSYIPIEPIPINSREIFGSEGGNSGGET